MRSSRKRRPPALPTFALGLVCALALAAPAVASAHGLVGRADLPIPPEMFGVAAAVVLIVSFLGLALLWTRPLLEQPVGRRLLWVPRWLDIVVAIICGAVGIALFVFIVIAGLIGTQSAQANIAPTSIYVLFWVGGVVVSLVFGDLFALFNPWRAVGRAVAWVARVLTRGTLPEPLSYPAWLGRWPAVAMLLIFTWVELVYSEGDSPRTLALLALGYAALQFVGMSLFGVEKWSTRADGFSVYFNIFSRLSLIGRRGRELILRRPLTGITGLEPYAGTVALLCTMLGTTVFDGASEGPIWTSIGPKLQSVFVDIGLGQNAALEVSFTIGLVASVGFVAAIYWIGVTGMNIVVPERSLSELASAFVHSLVPIAAAYVIAHYFSLLVYQSQAMAYLISDPLGDNSDIFGTAGSTIDYTVVTATGIWWVQVSVLVIGHVLGLVLAHDRALALFEDSRESTLSQVFMLAVMVGFTVLGLWLLSAANQ